MYNLKDKVLTEHSVREHTDLGIEIIVQCSIQKPI